jgi:hypothetical protein
LFKPSPNDNTVKTKYLYVVNPLTVSINGKGKERLILDLRHVNKQVVLNKIKFENWTTLKQYVTKRGFELMVYQYLPNKGARLSLNTKISQVHIYLLK